MSAENVAIVRALWESFAAFMESAPGGEPLEGRVDTPEQAEAVEAMLAWFEADVEWDLTNFKGWPEDRLYHGHEGIRRFWRAYLSAWGEIQWELEEFIDAGEQVVVLLRQTAVGRGSGAVTEFPRYAQVWTLRDGRVARFAVYTNRAEALLAAGVRAAPR